MKKTEKNLARFGGTQLLSREQMKKVTGGIENTWLCSCGGTNTDQSVYGESNTQAMRNMDTSNCNPGDIAICTPYL